MVHVVIPKVTSEGYMIFLIIWKNTFGRGKKPGKKLFLEKDDLRQEAVLLNASQPNYHEGAVLYGFLDGRTRGLLYFKAKTGSLALD